ncbi:uncharacterized protein DUF397 [Paractinoplanes brasiliensis]|uniref:Uncharacterized protein DUF397 n=1 Tax=Paractinoplanes brasiliensis TaxID=52695 RepID=A0A4R6K3Z1_9ACTN|nr:uncharacterized protein DUF397 [Actinoplanes brasiliensis]
MSVSEEFSGSTRWRRSSRCISDHHCVEVARVESGVLLRNSQKPDEVLRLTPDQWRDFLRMVRSLPGGGR